MDYPRGFPARLRPRLDAEILKISRKYPLAGDGIKRIKESLAAFADIALSAVANGEWIVDSAHAGFKSFALWLCTGYAHQRGMYRSDEYYDEFVEDEMTKLTGSIEWLGYLEKLAQLADNPEERPSQPSTEEPISLSEKRKLLVNPILTEKGWSILDWANESRVAYHTVADYLAGKTNPFRSTVAKLASSLGIAANSLP